MPIPTDPTLLDIACDVTIRFRAHESYGGETGALRALRRRAPGFAVDEYQAVFDVLRQVYDRAREAVARHQSRGLNKASKVAEFQDIDYAACLEQIDAIEPGLAMSEKGWILNWCIFWYYLK